MCVRPLPYSKLKDTRERCLQIYLHPKERASPRLVVVDRLPRRERLTNSPSLACYSFKERDAGNSLSLARQTRTTKPAQCKMKTEVAQKKKTRN